VGDEDTYGGTKGNPPSVNAPAANADENSLAANVDDNALVETTLPVDTSILYILLRSICYMTMIVISLTTVTIVKIEGDNEDDCENEDDEDINEPQDSHAESNSRSNSPVSGNVNGSPTKMTGRAQL
jgi:hypothetical protein